MLESFTKPLQKIENSLQNYFKGDSFKGSPQTHNKKLSSHQSLHRLEEAICYGVLSGGKRFRPLLSLLVAKALGKPEDRALPLGIAVELIHSYSLIHDDLPIMDNDDERRGKPTNHKVYGEVVALLAGDALQTEAFSHIGKAYESQPEIAIELILLLSDAIGVKGMVGGQAMDMDMDMDMDMVKNDLPQISPTLESMYQLHQMKTGALIRVSIEGAAVACGAPPEIRQNLKEFGEKLGLAFQLADDILDYNPQSPEKSGFPYLMGLASTRSQLSEISQTAIALLSPLGVAARELKDLTLWNAQRVNTQQVDTRQVEHSTSRTPNKSNVQRTEINHEPPRYIPR